VGFIHEKVLPPSPRPRDDGPTMRRQDTRRRALQGPWASQWALQSARRSLHGSEDARGSPALKNRPPAARWLQ
jgi:hypothetical protein